MDEIKLEKQYKVEGTSSVVEFFIDSDENTCIIIRRDEMELLLELTVPPKGLVFYKKDSTENKRLNSPKY